RPQAGRRELEQMTVGIAEIDALAAAAPSGPTLDRDATFAEPLRPVGKLVGADRKRNMQRAVAVVRRDGSARHAPGFEREAAPEEEQHALAADVIGAEARVTCEHREPEHDLVEPRRAIEIVDVEARLQHPVEPGHARAGPCIRGACPFRKTGSHPRIKSEAGFSGNMRVTTY